jgi:hypothetical protein
MLKKQLGVEMWKQWDRSRKYWGRSCAKGRASKERRCTHEWCTHEWCTHEWCTSAEGVQGQLAGDSIGLNKMNRRGGGGAFVE